MIVRCRQGRFWLLSALVAVYSALLGVGASSTADADASAGSFSRMSSDGTSSKKAHPKPFGDKEPPSLSKAKTKKEASLAAKEAKTATAKKARANAAVKKKVQPNNDNVKDLQPGSDVSTSKKTKIKVPLPEKQPLTVEAMPDKEPPARKESNKRKASRERTRLRAAQKYIRCDFCLMVVGAAYDGLGSERFLSAGGEKGSAATERVEKLCDIDDVFEQHEIIERVPAGSTGKGSKGVWELMKAGPTSSRSAEAVREQSLAMKEACNGTMKSKAAELAPLLLEGRRAAAAAKSAADGQQAAKESRDNVIRRACESFFFCRPPSGRDTEL